MPLYEYQCQSCGERVEVIQNFSDPPYAHCPKCGGDMKKLLSAPAIQFKGSGFYKTDYPSASSRSSSTKTDSSDSKPAKSDSSDSKPAKSDSSDSKPAKSDSSDSKPAKSQSKD